MLIRLEVHFQDSLLKLLLNTVHNLHLFIAGINYSLGCPPCMDVQFHFSLSSEILND